MNQRSVFRRFLLPAAVLGAVLQAGFAAADGKDEARTATACLRRTEIRGTKVLDARNVLITMRDRYTYRSELAKQCPGLNRSTVMALTYAENKLCAGSMFTVMMRVGASSNGQTVNTTNQSVYVQGPGLMPGAVCQLGVFTPISEDEVGALVAATNPGQRSRRRGDRDAVKTETVEPAPAPAESR